MAAAQVKQPTGAVDDFHAEPKPKTHCWRNCCLGLLVIVLAILMSASWMLARSGLVRIPLLSHWAYPTPPGPTRQVVTTDADTQSLGTVLDPALKGANSGDGMVTLTLSEAQLNALLRGKNNPNINVAFIDDTAEWFSQLELDQTTLYVTVRVRPAVQAGRLRVALVEARIGRLHLSTGLLNAVAQTLQSRLVDTNDLVKEIQFDTIGIAGGQLTLRGKLPPSFFDQAPSPAHSKGK